MKCRQVNNDEVASLYISQSISQLHVNSAGIELSTICPTLLVTLQFCLFILPQCSWLSQLLKLYSELAGLTNSPLSTVPRTQDFKLQSFESQTWCLQYTTMLDSADNTLNDNAVLYSNALISL
jgi:hypothetical protein